MSVRLRLSVLATLLAPIVAPGLQAQQRGEGALLHPVDTTGRVTLFPRSIGSGVTAAPAAPSRFEILAHQIDSASAIGGRMQSAAAERAEAARMSGRFLLLSQVARGLERHTGPTRAGLGMDWVSAVTAVGVSQLGRTALFAPTESSPSIWRTLRNDGQFAGLATITGGASWLLSSLALHSTRFGVPHAHIMAGPPHK
jgi:hypothetical protein